MRTEPNEATFRTVKSADTRPDKSSAIRERSRRVQSNQAPKISSNSRANLTTSISSEGRWSPAELRSLPFGDFARIMAELMTRMGYENVRLVGRAAGGGRNGTGGYDLHCSVRGGEFGGRRRTVLVLLKQFARNAWVFQRMVDELRGVAVREGADGAILLTTGRLSPVIAQCEDRDANDEGFTLRTMPPVQRFDGIQLCRLLSLYGIGQPRPSVPAEPDPGRSTDAREIEESAVGMGIGDHKGIAACPPGSPAGSVRRGRRGHGKGDLRDRSFFGIYSICPFLVIVPEPDNPLSPAHFLT